MGSEIGGVELSGIVEVDGAYFGRQIHIANDKENRRDRWLAENRTGKHRFVVVGLVSGR